MRLPRLCGGGGRNGQSFRHKEEGEGGIPEGLILRRLGKGGFGSTKSFAPLLNIGPLPPPSAPKSAQPPNERKEFFVPFFVERKWRKSLGGEERQTA